MQVKTKFNYGDQVWFMAGNFKATAAFVRTIKVYVTKEGAQITYGCHPDEDTEKTHVYLKVEEERTFASKQDLLNSL